MLSFSSVMQAAGGDILRGSGIVAVEATKGAIALGFTHFCYQAAPFFKSAFDTVDRGGCLEAKQVREVGVFVGFSAVFLLSYYRLAKLSNQIVKNSPSSKGRDNLNTLKNTTQTLTGVVCLGVGLHKYSNFDMASFFKLKK
ncbi:hypothetical protein K9K77_03425 [Candidatus Babeliales bacterium]|nr:hypothetical protein [Candidatus Babeliales bacterium]